MVKSNIDLTFRLADSNKHDSWRFCELSNALYARKVDDAYYHWQFFDTPFPGLLSFAMTNDGELAGCYGFHLRQVSATGESIGMALDIMVAPKFQGQGVFRRLADFARGQLRPYKPVAVYVMTNQRAEAPHVRGLGWMRVNTFTDWACATAAGSGKQKIEVIPAQSLTAEDEEFVKKVERLRNERQGFSLARSSGFLEWRFARNPRYSFKLFRCALQGRLWGILALKVFRDPVTDKAFGDIVDLIWAEDDPEAMSAALKFALSYFHNNQIEEAVTWLQTNTVLDQVGRDLGFRPTERRRYLCCKVEDERYLGLGDPGKWLVTMADTDIY